MHLRMEFDSGIGPTCLTQNFFPGPEIFAIIYPSDKNTLFLFKTLLDSSKLCGKIISTWPAKIPPCSGPERKKNIGTLFSQALNKKLLVFFPNLKPSFLGQFLTYWAQGFCKKDSASGVICSAGVLTFRDTALLGAKRGVPVAKNFKILSLIFSLCPYMKSQTHASRF